MAKLSGKTALVTGASRGIGRGIALRLAADGARVGVHYGSNDAAAKEVVATIEQAGGNAFPIRAELGVPGDVDALFTALEAELAGAPLDILVNNAGILDPTPIEELAPEAFDLTFAVNVKAPFFITQRALGLVPDGGRIIFVSSAVTRIASTFFHYTMTKAANEALGFTLAQALGRRSITVNSVAPGVTDTDMGSWVHSAPGLKEEIEGSTAAGRLGQPSDIADVVAFLASDDARWITGATVDASGGMWLGPAAE
ncbi:MULTISPECIES: SDR family NAD(P)-dependent oxidoreductase [unclassified Saccharothrix]|uniref:SDR family NAD(P)-dependent oxidoreductase n=1 Tax=unclassified Saccharothrix TaxID=2593673 RepID=UPI00307DD70C